MSCDSCAKKAKLNISKPILKMQQLKNGECEIQIEQLLQWRNKLICFKDKSLYKTYNVSAQALNKNLGIVLSAINVYKTNKCRFKKELEEISVFMMIVENSNKC